MKKQVPTAVIVAIGGVLLLGLVMWGFSFFNSGAPQQSPEVQKSMADYRASSASQSNPEEGRNPEMPPEAAARAAGSSPQAGGSGSQ